jgi:hypothetical protein
VTRRQTHQQTATVGDTTTGIHSTDEIGEPVERGEAPPGHEGTAVRENTDGTKMDMDIQIRDM